jgi:hypothetical protein
METDLGDNEQFISKLIQLDPARQPNGLSAREQ